MENITLYIIQTSLKHETNEVERNCSCEKGITSHDYCPVLWCREKGGKLKDINDIPYGHMFPMQRSGNPVEDRQFRRKVEEANRNGDCIINVGNGYYRPVPGDTTDEIRVTRISGERVTPRQSDTDKAIKNENDI